MFLEFLFLDRLAGVVKTPPMNRRGPHWLDRGLSGWIGLRRLQRDMRRDSSAAAASMLQRVVTRVEEASEAGLPFRPLTHQEIHGGEPNFWRLLVQLAPGSDYCGFEFFEEDPEDYRGVHCLETEPPNPDHLATSQRLCGWPPHTDEGLKNLVKGVGESALFLRKLDLQRRLERDLVMAGLISDQMDSVNKLHEGMIELLAEFGLELIWDPSPAWPPLATD